MSSKKINIPAIDLTKARTGSKEDRLVIAEAISEACKTWGFMKITGHGIDKSIFDDAYNSLNAFFALPLEVKQGCVTDDRPCPYQINGFSGLLAENANALMGKPHLPADPLEKFSMGRALLDDDFKLPFPDAEKHPTVVNLRKHMKNYYNACLQLTNMMSELFALSLGEKEDYFLDKVDKSEDYMRMHDYPVKSDEYEENQGFAEHLDAVLMTILTNIGDALEVQTPDHGWVLAETGGPDEFLVNFGDLMQRWSNDVWVSTLHRVRLSESKRQAIIFFKGVNDDIVIDAFPKFVQEKGGKKAYEPIVYLDYIKELTEKLFGK